MAFYDDKPMTIKQAYSLLEVSENSSMDQIKQSYRTAAKLYHPDVSTGLADADKFQMVVTAYNFIVEHKNKKVFSTARFTTRRRPPKREQAYGYGTGSQGFRFTDFMRKGNSQSDATRKTPFSKGSPSTLIFPELLIRFDKASNDWIKVETVHAIYNNYKDRFEAFATPRLSRVSKKVLIELIDILGRMGTDTALNTIAPYLLHSEKRVCCTAFMVLERAGENGEEIIDAHLRTMSAFVYHLTSPFNSTPLEKRLLKQRAVSSAKMRRLKAVKSKTGFSLHDILEGVGVPTSNLA